jgi:hypothetical protein
MKKIKNQHVSLRNTSIRSSSTPPSTVPVSNLPQIVRRYFSKPETLVAYKGGQFEKNLLDQQIGIPSVNLENCGHHLTPNAYHHCLKVKVEAFAMWLW